MDFNRTNCTVLHRAQLDGYFHLMPRAARDHGFFTRIVNLTRPAGQPSDNCRKALDNRSLLGAKTAANARLDDANFALRNTQCIGHIAANMERNLRRTLNDQSAIGIHPAVRRKRLHHRLLILNGVISLLYDLIAGREHRIDIAMAHILVIDGIALVVAVAPIALRPVILRMNQGLIVQ